ncbi:anti-sigma factor, partial [Thioclava sp. BHET1]
MTRAPITEDDLHAYIDAALPPERREEVARYLDDHPDVAARIHAYRDQAAALARALAPVAEEPVPAELTLANLTAARRRSGWGGRELAAGLVLFALGLGSGWGLHLYDLPGEMGVLTHEAAQNYAVFGADYTRPVEMPGEDVKSLEHWLAQRMRHPVMVPDLTAAGYRLMGGRIVATGKGPGALVM